MPSDPFFPWDEKGSAGKPALRTPRRPAARPKPRPPARRRPPLLAFSWRWVSALMVLALSAALTVIWTNKAFTVSQAEVGGVRYVPAAELFALAGVAGQHILQVDPQEVAARLEASPSLDAAQVIVRWPARVIILVREREPALIWEQGGERYWVDVNGHLMPLRAELPQLVRVINEGAAIPFRCPGPACEEGAAVSIDAAVVLGTQQLKTLRTNIDVLYYDPVHGLSYQDGRGWRGYFGVGTDMNLKLLVYETLVADLEARGLQPVYIDVSNPQAPFYRLSR